LDDATPSELFELVKSWCLTSFGMSTAVAVKLLERSSHSHDEARWLLGVLTKEAEVLPEFSGEDAAVKKRTWMAGRFSDDSPKSKAWRGHLFLRIGRQPEALQLFKESAEAGCSAGFTPFGVVARERGDKDLALKLFNQAAELNETEALYQLGAWFHTVDPCKSLAFYLRGARLGNSECMGKLSKNTTDDVEQYIWFARFFCHSTHANIQKHMDYVCGELLRHPAENAESLFVVGRELDGIREIWGEEMHLQSECERTVEIYNMIAGNARRASLQVFVVVRDWKVLHYHIGNDVAKIIAKLVYASRRQAALQWYKVGVCSV
jgi:hypothetical protein